MGYLVETHHCTVHGWIIFLKIDQFILCEGNIVKQKDIDMTETVKEKDIDMTETF
jgi:hypothetical protein